MINPPLLFLALTFIIYYGAWRIQQRLHWLLLNPVLVTIVALILLLQISGLDYSDYNAGGGRYIEFWLKPAVVALGLPLYRQLSVIKRQFVAIFMSQLIGSIVGILSVTSIARLLGASPAIVLSLAPKSVSTPIAIEITNQIGGIPSVTSAVVVCVGILGSIIGLKFLSLCGEFHEGARGISVGTASHALGTARMFALSPSLGAYATLGLILNGIFTSVLAPLLMGVLGWL